MTKKKSKIAQYILARHHEVVPSSAPPPYAGGGKLKQFNTGSHASGKDTPVDVNGTPSTKNPVARVQDKENVYNGYVYSDKLTNPETGNKFSEDMAKLAEKYKGYETDSAKKNALDFEATRLAKSNDMVRTQDDVTSIEKAYGGKLPEMTDGGTLYQRLNAYMTENDPRKKIVVPPIESVDPYVGRPKINVSPIGSIDSRVGAGRQTVKPVETLSGVGLKPLEMPEKNLPNMENPMAGGKGGGSKIGNMMPALIGKGTEFALKTAEAFVKDDTGERPVYNPYESRVRSMMMSRAADSTAAKNEIRSGINAALESNRQSARSAGVKMALDANTFESGRDSQAQLAMQEQREQNQLIADAAQVENNLGQQRVAATNLANQIKAQNKGVRATNRSNLYESIGNAGAFVTNMKNKNLSSTAQLLMLNSMFPNFEINAKNMPDFLTALEEGRSLVKFKKG